MTNRTARTCNHSQYRPSHFRLRTDISACRIVGRLGGMFLAYYIIITILTFVNVFALHDISYWISRNHMLGLLRLLHGWFFLSVLFTEFAIRCADLLMFVIQIVMHQRTRRFKVCGSRT